MIRDRNTYYDAMLRHGWKLPAKKQSICTLEFMTKVRAGEIFCPHAQHIKSPAICVTPPPKKILIDKIVDAGAMREQKGEDVASLEKLCERLCNKRSADTAFLVQVLHLVNSEDEIFARNYVYHKPAQAKTAVTMPLMNNADGFYDNLPVLSSKGKRGKQQLRLSKAEKEAIQLQILENRQAQLAARINALRGRAANGGQDGSADEEEK